MSRGREEEEGGKERTGSKLVQETQGHLRASQVPSMHTGQETGDGIRETTQARRTRASEDDADIVLGLRWLHRHGHWEATWLA